MEQNKELERLAKNNNLTSLPANPWEFEVDLGIDPQRSLEKMMSVICSVAQVTDADWPSDDEWRRNLPDWLKAAMPELSKEETDKLLSNTPKANWDLLPWDFLSWLDALRERGWRWWGYKMNGSKANIVLHVAMFPERIDSFRELLRAAGVSIISERYV